MSHKKLIITVLFIIVITTFFLVLVFFSNDEKQIDSSEVNFLKENNSKAINEASSKEVKKIESINEDDHYLGYINSQVELIVYCDFTNIFCGDLYDTIEDVKNDYDEKLVVVYRSFLVSNDEVSLSAAMTAECAAEQGKFWETHKELYGLNKDGGLTMDNVSKIVDEIGLDVDQYDNCMANQRYKDKLVDQINDAKKRGVLGAPTMFVNKELLPGAYPLEDFTDSSGRERKGLKSVVGKYL